MKEVKNIQDLKNASFFKMPKKIFGIEQELIKLFLIPIGLLVVFLVSFGLVIIPKIEEIKSNFDQISGLKSQIKLNEQKKNYLISIDQEQLNKDASYLNQAVLREKKSYLLVGVIRSIADGFSYRIKSFSLNPGTLKEGFSEKLKISDNDLAIKMPIKLTLVGPSNRNLDLIKSLENSLPILFIDRFDSKTISGISELDLVISSYYLPERSDYITGNLTLNDLRLTSKESDLLMKISEFKGNSILSSESDLKKEFVEYERSDPFSL